jgi:hypothetical protein
MSSIKFNKDLDFGNKYENELLKYIDYDNYDIKQGLFKDYDIEVIKDNKPTYYEVKSDRLTHITKNIVIEYMCSNKPSGISTTTADYYAYFVVYPDNDYDLYIIPTKVIREYISYKYYTKIKGGDNNRSRMYKFVSFLFGEYKIKK